MLKIHFPTFISDRIEVDAINDTILINGISSFFFIKTLNSFELSKLVYGRLEKS